MEGQLSEEDAISINMGGKRNKLYIVAGLDPNSAQFAPKNKGVSEAESLLGWAECGFLRGKEGGGSDARPSSHPTTRG